MNWETAIDIYTLLCIKQITNENLLYSIELVLCGDLNGKENQKKKGYIHTHTHPHTHRTALVAQTVKNLPAMQETQVRSLGWEDPLDKKIATHFSILA